MEEGQVPAARGRARGRGRGQPYAAQSDRNRAEAGQPSQNQALEEGMQRERGLDDRMHQENTVSHTNDMLAACSHHGILYSYSLRCCIH